MVLGYKPLTLIQHSLIHTAYWKTKFGSDWQSHLLYVNNNNNFKSRKKVLHNKITEKQGKTPTNGQTDSKLGSNIKYKMADTQVKIN